MKLTAIVTILVLILIVSPFTRIQKIKHVSNTESHVDEYPDLRSTPELIKLGTVSAANQGPYLISGYRHSLCSGSIAILPLHRNAEGGFILRKILQDDSLRYGILFKGKIHTRFPQVSYTIEKFRYAVQGLSGRQPKADIRALAFAEQGECELAEQLVRYTF